MRELADDRMGEGGEFVVAHPDRVGVGAGVERDLFIFGQRGVDEDALAVQSGPSGGIAPRSQPG